MRLQVAWILAVAGVAAAQQPVKPESFGMHFHRAENVRDFSVFAGGSVRLHDAGVSWRELEHAEDRWDFSRLDAMVERFRANQVRPLLVLGVTPEWAAQLPASQGVYGPGAASPPRSAPWQRYVSTVVERYATKIEAYEIWNEADIKKFFLGRPDELARLTNEACAIIRVRDPKAKIVSSAPSGVRSIEFMQEYLREVKPECIDAIGVHLYVDNEVPERILDYVAAVRQTLRGTSFASTPIWNTEAGWLIRQPGKIPKPSAVGFPDFYAALDDELARQYVARAHVTAFSAGVERFYWYAWDNSEMGFGSAALRDSYFDVRSLLTGAIIGPCSKIGDTMRCAYKRDETRGTLAWGIRPSGGARKTSTGMPQHCSATAIVSGRLFKDFPLEICSR